MLKNGLKYNPKDRISLKELYEACIEGLSESTATEEESEYDSEDPEPAASDKTPDTAHQTIKELNDTTAFHDREQ